MIRQQHKDEIVVAEMAKLDVEGHRAFADAMARILAAAPPGPVRTEGLVIAVSREAGEAVKAGSPIANALVALAQSEVDDLVIARMVRNGM